jgi:hypothetical protein
MPATQKSEIVVETGDKLVGGRWWFGRATRSYFSFLRRVSVSLSSESCHLHNYFSIGDSNATLGDKTRR